MITKINIKIIRNNMIFDKLEKIYDEKYKRFLYFLVSEDNSIKISAKKFTNYQIECNECHNLSQMKGNVLTKTSKQIFLCRSCRNKGERNGYYGKHHTEETKQKISESLKGEKNSFYGKHHTEETKQKISENNKGRLKGENNPMYAINVYEYIKQRDGEDAVIKLKQKISESVKGEKNGFYGKHHTEETKQKLKEYALSEERLSMIKSEEYRKKITNGMLNSTKLKESRTSEEYKEKLSRALKNSEKFKEAHQKEEYRNLRRKLAREQICRNIELSGKDISKRYFIPNFNIKACEYFDKIMKETGTHIQHALNGGEFCIKELGYFVDGYDKENNIVYEFDENYHNTKAQKEKDILREEQIKKVLKCKFIRIKENEIN